MKVFEYMGRGDKWKTHARYKFNGNDMVLAINAMQEKLDFKKFFLFAYDKMPILTNQINEEVDYEFSLWLFGNPAKFFELLAEALEKKIISE